MKQTYIKALIGTLQVAGFRQTKFVPSDEPQLSDDSIQVTDHVHIQLNGDMAEVGVEMKAGHFKFYGPTSPRNYTMLIAHVRLAIADRAAQRTNLTEIGF